MAREEIITCDLCGKTGGVTWRLSRTVTGDDLHLVDVCPEHEKPLLALLERSRFVTDWQPNGYTVNLVDRVRGLPAVEAV